LKRLFHLFDITLRYIGACIGAELIRDGQLAYVVDWFKRPITVEEVHQINLTALRRAHASSATGMFALLQELYPQAEILDIVKDLLEGRQRFKDVGGRMDDAAAGRLHAALSRSMERLMRRLAPVARFQPLIVLQSLPRAGGGFEARGLAAVGPDPVFPPAVAAAERAFAPGTVVLRGEDGAPVPLDPWILHQPCPMCRERHLFLLKDILDPAALYISVEGDCLLSLPLSGQALLTRAVGGGAAGGGPEAPRGEEEPAKPAAARPSAALGMRLSRSFQKRGQGIRSLAWSPDGRWLAAGGGDGAVRVDEYESGEPMAVLKHHVKPVTGLAWSPDQRRIASAGKDGAIVVWETARWKPIDVKEGSWFYPATALAWSPSGVLLASAHEESRVWIWDTGTWKMHAMLEGHGEGASCLAWFGPRYLLTGAADGRVRMWDTYARKQLWIAYAHDKGVTALAQSPDGRWLISAGGDGVLLLWNAQEGLPLKNLETGGAAIVALSASREGQYLASRSADGVLRIWDTAAWETAAVMRETPPDRGTIPIQFHPFNPLLASVDPVEKRIRVLRVDPDPPGEITAWGAPV
jgi:WD40 repeat protein